MLLAVGAAALQVMVAPFLPATALILLVLTIPAAIVAAAGATTPSRRMFEYPLALAILGGVLIFIIGIVAAATDAESWVAAWTQFDIVLMWIGVWALRSRDIAHKESAWNRLFAHHIHLAGGAGTIQVGIIVFPIDIANPKADFTPAFR